MLKNATITRALRLVLFEDSSLVVVVRPSATVCVSVRALVVTVENNQDCDGGGGGWKIEN